MITSHAARHARWLRALDHRGKGRVRERAGQVHGGPLARDKVRERHVAVILCMPGVPVHGRHPVHGVPVPHLQGVVPFWMSLPLIGMHLMATTWEEQELRTG